MNRVIKIPVNDNTVLILIYNSPNYDSKKLRKAIVYVQRRHVTQKNIVIFCDVFDI